MRGESPSAHNDLSSSSRVRYRRLLPAGVVIPLLAGASLLPWATPASAANNGKFSVSPPSHSPSGRGVFTPVLAPGVSSKTSVVVVNETDAPLTLNLYAADAYTSSSGAFTLQPPFKPKHYIGAWIQLPVDKITVAARSGDIVPFTYNPPPDVAPGDYAGGIVAEQTQGAVTQKGTVRVNALEAVGSAVFGRVLGPLHPRLAVSAVSLSTTGSLATQFGGPVDAKVTYSITNTGNKNLHPDVTISLKPLLGSGPPTERVKLPQVLPGSTVTFSHTFHSVEPFGRLTATVVARAPGAQASGSASVLVIPWGLAAIVVILLAIILWRWRRRRNRRRPAPIDEPGSDPDGAPNGIEAMATGPGKAKAQGP